MPGGPGCSRSKGRQSSAPSLRAREGWGGRASSWRIRWGTAWPPGRDYGSAVDFTRSLRYRGARGAVFERYSRTTRAQPCRRRAPASHTFCWPDPAISAAILSPCAGRAPDQPEAAQASLSNPQARPLLLSCP
jgi:hypothetical protein